MTGEKNIYIILTLRIIINSLAMKRCLHRESIKNRNGSKNIRTNSKSFPGMAIVDCLIKNLIRQISCHCPWDSCTPVLRIWIQIRITLAHPDPQPCPALFRSNTRVPYYKNIVLASLNLVSKPFKREVWL